MDYGTNINISYYCKKKSAMKFTFLFIFGLFLMLSCNRRITSTNESFSVKECYYETWVASKTEKGTNITVNLIRVTHNIEFDSIIFNEMELPVTVIKNNGNYTLKASITSPTSKLPTELKKVNKPNQLVYRINNIRYFYLLNNIERKKMKYYTH